MNKNPVKLIMSEVGYLPKVGAESSQYFITMLKLLIPVIRELYIPIETNNTLMSVVLVSRNVTPLFSLNNSPTGRKFAIRWNGEGYLYLIVNGLGTF